MKVTLGKWLMSSKCWYCGEERNDGVFGAWGLHLKWKCQRAPMGHLFSRWLIETRQRRELSQEAVAALLGWSGGGAVSGYEGFSRTPKLATIEKFEAALGETFPARRALANGGRK